MKKSILRFKQIVINDKLFPRAKINERTVLSYKNAMKKGDVFPPLYVALFKGKYYLIDGRHRYEAYSILAEEHIQCEIKKNFTSFDDMFLASIRANLIHGLPLTKADKFKIAYTMQDMKFELEGISKVTGLEMETLEKSSINKMSLRDLFDKKKIPREISIKSIKSEPKGDIEVVTEDKILSKKELKRDYHINTLREIHSFLKKEKFDLYDKRIYSLLTKIKKLIIFSKHKWRKLK